MADGTFDLRPDEARLLLNVALMATGKNFFKSATKILAALEGFRPGEESVGTAKVILMISIGEFEMAVDYIDREALAKWPDSPVGGHGAAGPLPGGAPGDLGEVKVEP